MKIQALLLLFCVSTITAAPYAESDYVKLAAHWLSVNRTEEALECYQQILNLNPNNFEAAFSCGTEYYKLQNFDQALVWYQKACVINPLCHQAHYNQAVIYGNRNELEKAQQLYEQAISICPTYVRAFVMLGDTLNKLHKIDESIQQYKNALAIESTCFDAHLHLARIYMNKHLFDLSLNHFEKAIEQHPRDQQALLDYANTLNMVNNLDRAFEVYHQLNALNPNQPSILYNLAYTYKKIGKIKEAQQYYDRVLSLKPDYAEAHFGLSLTYLLTGDLKKGFEEYEWRWDKDEHPKRNLSKPVWDGSYLYGKTILLHCEQGLGDTYQFIRYAQIAHDRGGRVVVASQDQLIQILKLVPYIDQVVSLFGDLPPFDVHAPLMSLPYIIGTTLDTVPANIPYLYARPDLIELWKHKLSSDKNFKIGICWQGNSNYSTPFLRHAVAAKSVPATIFATLGSVQGVSIYNLQKVTGTDQINNLPQGFILHSFDNEFDATHGRFMDTAAVMKNLDLVITIDTSIAHLAGGLGVPVWVLLPEPPDWRWMLAGSTTPWYPNMRLFRQPSIGDWTSVILDIHDALEELVMRYYEKR